MKEILWFNRWWGRIVRIPFLILINFLVLIGLGMGASRTDLYWPYKSLSQFLFGVWEEPE